MSQLSDASCKSQLSEADTKRFTVYPSELNLAQKGDSFTFTVIVGSKKIPICYHVLRHFCPSFPALKEGVPNSTELLLDEKVVDAQAVEDIIKSMRHPFSSFLQDSRARLSTIYEAALYLKCDDMVRRLDTDFEDIMGDAIRTELHLGDILQVATHHSRDSLFYATAVRAMCGSYIEGTRAARILVNGNICPSGSAGEKVVLDVIKIAAFPWSNKHHCTTKDVQQILNCPLRCFWDIETKSVVAVASAPAADLK